MDDTLDSLLGGSDEEAEEDAVISQVLDEIGIEVNRKVRSPLSPHSSHLPSTFHPPTQLAGVGVASGTLPSERSPVATGQATSDLEERLKQLHS